MQGCGVNMPVWNENLLQKTCCQPKRPAVAKQPLVFIAVPTHPQKSHAGSISSYGGVFIRSTPVAVINNLSEGKVIFCTRNMSAQ
jgi:hypothetical protein